MLLGFKRLTVGMSESRVQRKMFGVKGCGEGKEGGKTCIMSSFVICVLNKCYCLFVCPPAVTTHCGCIFTVR